MKLLISLSAAAVALSFGAGSASAQFGGLPKAPKLGGSSGQPSKAEREQFRTCDQSGRKGLSKVPTNFGSSADKKAKALAKAEELYEQAKAACTPALSHMSSFASAMKRFDELTVLIEDARLQVALLADYEPLAQALKDNQRLDEAKVAELTAQSQAYTAAAKNADQERYAGHWAKKVTSLADADLASKAKYDALHAQAEVDREMLAKHAAIDDFAPIVGAMNDHIDTGSGPIPADLYAKYEAQIVKVEAFNPTARLYYEPELKKYRAYDAWLAGAGAADALAKIYEGTVVLDATSKGKKASFKLKTKADHCYLMLLRFTLPGGKQDLHWTQPLKTQHLQRFYLESVTRHQRGNGFCMTEAQALTYAGPLTFAGTKNSLRAVVIEWPKTTFPAFLTTRIRRWVDSCDPVQFEERWTKPVPGTVAHRAVGDIKAWDAVHPGSCGVSPERDSYALSAKYGRCNEKVYAKFAPKISRAEKLKEDARTTGAVKAAIKSLDRLKGQRSAAYGKQCEPIMKKIRAAYVKANDRVADTMMGEAYSDHIDRTKRIADEDAGHTRPRGEDGKPERINDRDDRTFRMRNYEQYYKGK